MSWLGIEWIPGSYLCFTSNIPLMPVPLFLMAASMVFEVCIGDWYFIIVFLSCKSISFQNKNGIFSFDPNTFMLCLSSRWYKLVFLGLTILGYLIGCIVRMDNLHHWRKTTNLMLKTGIQAMLFLGQNLREFRSYSFCLRRMDATTFILILWIGSNMIILVLHLCHC